MGEAATTYRNFRIYLKNAAPGVVGQVVSPNGETRYVVRAQTVFGAADKAFDLIDEILHGATDTPLTLAHPA